MKITEDVKTGRLLAGLYLPKGAVILGTVTRDNGESGALLRLASGRLIQ